MDSAPFHAGERAAQRLAGFEVNGGAIRDFMPDQHRTFFAMLPFVMIGGMAADGTLAAAILTGVPGFIASPDARTLQIAAASNPAEPITAMLVDGAEIGLLGIDLATRRRNRANGRLVAVAEAGLTVAVRQSFGNCPKYIQVRDLLPPVDGPLPAADGERLSHLDDDARRLIGAADTFFVASASGPDPLTHGGVDISHRGGPSGFVRVEDDRLTIPDFSGNRYFNTLGNFVRHPRAALLFIDFVTGDLLHLAGAVTVDWRPPSDRPDAQRSWRLEVRKAWRQRGAVPLRWALRESAP